MHNSNGSNHCGASLVIKIILVIYFNIAIFYINIINGAPSSSISSSLSSSSSSSSVSISSIIPSPSSSSSAAAAAAALSSPSTSLVGSKSALDSEFKKKNLNSIDGSDTNYTNLTRQHDGDLFSANDISKCNIDTCVGLSSGTASLLVQEGTKSEISRRRNSDDSNHDGCTCRCHSYLSTYREDLEICVDDIRECALSPFTSGSSSEKIPFVFLPLRGQIIYPSREISFSEIQTPICAVTGSQYLTTNGWAELRNPTDTDLPFRIFRDEGRTFLQWLGEPELRQKMQGRLVLIHLMCRDMKLSSKIPPKPNGSNIFTPCVAFRINGSPVKYINNVSEVLFQSEASSNLAAVADGLSAREYIVIGVCSLLLGLIYVASVFLYLHVKKRKNLSSEPARSSIDDLDNDINYPKNDQVTFGVPFTRTGSSYSVSSINDHRNSQRSHHSRSLNSPVGVLKEDMGIIKNNPLLKHFPSLSDHSGFTSDLSNSNSEFEETQSNKTEKIKINQTSAVVHPSSSSNKIEVERNATHAESSPSPTQENECLPEANVSIIEEVGAEEKQLENMRAMINGTVRKKLYFNPAYFEPHLLLSPPPAAIEFLTKIREVIAIAKYKMATKRYQPSLGAILEENRSESSIVSAKRNRNHFIQNINFVMMEEQMKLKESSVDGRSIENVNKNIGDKANSIQKWLETVPPLNQAINTNSGKQNQVDFERSSFNMSPVNKTKINLKETSHKIEQKQESNRNIRKLSPPKSKPPPIPESASKSGIYSSNIKTSMMQQQTERVEISSPLNSDTNTQVIYHHDNTISPVLMRKHFDSNPIYQYSDTRIEIYNNPKFNHTDSPQLSQKSRSTRSKSSRKRMEVLDQYANPQKLEPSHYELMKNFKQMPDMVYEALAKDYSMGMFSSSSRPNSLTFSIPTPDYDSTLDEKIKNIYNNSQNGSITVPPVPTPDYSSLGKRSNGGRQHQPPDSPIYRRKSPQYLIVDYETDSLERTTNQSRKLSNSSSPASNNSSEASSQPSPSLSTALPLEEEVEIRNTVYDKVEGFRKDGDILVKKKISKNFKAYEEVRNHEVKKKLEPLIKYDTPFRGSMTIEVQHEPLSDFEPSTDSDQFEPDTLDRKPKKHSFCDVKSEDAWSEHLKKSNNFVNSAEEKVSYSSLENMTSLPDFGNSFGKNNRLKNNSLILKSSSSFRSNIETANKRIDSNYEDETDTNLMETRPSFGSLREIYQSKVNRNQHQRPKLTNVDFATEQGRLLTLEAKHTKRQRQIREEKELNLKILPPDVVPTSTAVTISNTNSNISNSNSSGESKDDSDSKIYYEMKKSIKVSNSIDNDDKSSIKSDSKTKLIRKNFQGWNTDNFNGIQNVNILSNNIRNNNNNNNNSNSNNNNNNKNDIKNEKINEKINKDPDYYSHDETEETISNHSESTEITGVSDTQGNSEFEDDNKSKDKTEQQQQQNRKNKSKFRKNFIVNLPVTTNTSDETNSNSNNSNKSSSSAIQKNSPRNSVASSKSKILSSIKSKNKRIDMNGDFSYDRYIKRKKNQEKEQENQNENNEDSEKSSIENDGNNESNESNKYSKELIYPDQNSNIKQVYRVEIESPLNGMQIAMGLKDRSKKSKDLKNAWKKFVCLATSKLNPNSIVTKSNEDSEIQNDEKNCTSNFYIDEENPKESQNFNQNQQKYQQELSKQFNFNKKLFNGRFNLFEPTNQFNGLQKQNELDSGYMSAESNEVYARRFYERYNFKKMSESEQSVMIDTIEDNFAELESINDNIQIFEKKDDDKSAKNVSNNNDTNWNSSNQSSTKKNNCRSGNCNIKAGNGKGKNQINERMNDAQYSIEDENIVATASESDDDGGNTEDLSESGAESVETHSVFFKNIRKKF